MRYAYYTIIQIKIPFQDDVSFEDQKKKGRRPDLSLNKEYLVPLDQSLTLLV